MVHALFLVQYKAMNRRLFFLIVCSFVIVSCDKGETRDTSTDSGKDGWLKGNEEEKFDVIANQLRGFDMAMAETGYRYNELFWAGADQNWEYARYQLKKIRLTIENGLERRPKRSESAQDFLNNSIPEMERVINLEDTANFNMGFSLFTNACNHCHAKENVPFFNVRPPINRQSPIRK